MDMYITIYRKGIDRTIFDYSGQYYLIHPHERFIGRVRRRLYRVAECEYRLNIPLINYMYKGFLYILQHLAFKYYK